MIMSSVWYSSGVLLLTRIQHTVKAIWEQKGYNHQASYRNVYTLMTNINNNFWYYLVQYVENMLSCELCSDGLMWKGSICFFIKKHLELFRFQPLVCCFVGVFLLSSEYILLYNACKELFKSSSFNDNIGWVFLFIMLITYMLNIHVF